MAKISLLKKIEDSKKVTFRFVGMTPTKTQPNEAGVSETIIALELEVPMDRVTGTQMVNLEDGMRRAFSDNVLEVNVSQSDIEFAGDDAFTWDEDEGIGTYTGSELVLDVAKRNAAVWLKSVPFNVQASEYRGQQNRTRLRDTFGTAAGIMGKINAKEAKVIDGAKA